MTRATVIVPTTGDRGPALEVAVRSVQRQTVDDIEVFIIGDGVDDETRSIVRRLAAADDRIRFVDRPKHTRRGEPYRHEVLTNDACGRIVAYLTDRDLWFSDHLAELDRTLTDCDLATTLEYDVDAASRRQIRFRTDLTTMNTQPLSRRRHLPGRLSMTGHTLDAYRRLPHGWRETPRDRFTDSYLFDQFLDQPWNRAGWSALPTVVWLKRGDHPGLPTPQRRDLLLEWEARLTAPGGEAALRAEVLANLWTNWHRLESRRLLRRLKRPVDELRWRAGRGWHR